MARIIAIHGATGMHGGSVVKGLLKSEWKVRAITRNATGDAAKSLSDAGVEVVAANFDDELLFSKLTRYVNTITLGSCRYLRQH